MSSFGAVRQSGDPDALSDFNQVSCLAFNMPYLRNDPC